MPKKSFVPNRRQGPWARNQLATWFANCSVRIVPKSKIFTASEATDFGQWSPGRPLVEKIFFKTREITLHCTLRLKDEIGLDSFSRLELVLNQTLISKVMSINSLR